MIIIVPVVTKVIILKQCECLSFSQGYDKFKVNDDTGTDMFAVENGKIKVCMGRSVVVISIATRLKIIKNYNGSYQLTTSTVDIQVSSNRL